MDMIERTPRHSTIIEAIHAWRVGRQSTDDANPMVLRMHPSTASELEESALQYPYNAASREADGQLRIWGMCVDVDATISIGNFEILPRHVEP